MDFADRLSNSDLMQSLRDVALHDLQQISLTRRGKKQKARERAGESEKAKKANDG